MGLEGGAQGPWGATRWQGHPPALPATWQRAEIVGLEEMELVACPSPASCLILQVFLGQHTPASPVPDSLLEAEGEALSVHSRIPPTHAVEALAEEATDTEEPPERLPTTAWPTQAAVAAEGLTIRLEETGALDWSCCAWRWGPVCAGPARLSRRMAVHPAQLARTGLGMDSPAVWRARLESTAQGLGWDCWETAQTALRERTLEAPGFLPAFLAPSVQPAPTQARQEARPSQLARLAAQVTSLQGADSLQWPAARFVVLAHTG